MAETQDQTDRRPTRPAGARRHPNAFRAQTDVRSPVPVFAGVRDHLPEPILPQPSEWQSTYWSDWERVWSCLEVPPANSPLSGPTWAAERGSPIPLSHSAIVARLAGYALPGFDLVHLLDNFYESQLEDGYIPGELDMHSGESCYLPFDPNSAGPNLLAWTEWRHFRLTGDDTRLREVFLPIVAYHRWLRLHRTWQSGLYWSTGYASGNPKQTCVPDGAFHHGHWAWLAPTLQANMSALLLGRIAERLGESDTVEDMLAERIMLGRQINARLWNDETDFYHPAGPDGQFSSVRSMTAYWALLDRQLVGDDRRKAMVQALRDEHNVLRKQESAFAAGDTVPIGLDDQTEPISRTPFSTHVALRSLQTSGAWKLAHNVAVDALGPGGALSLSGSAGGHGSPVSAALRIATMLEQVIGLRIDWPLRQVSWHNYLGDEAEVGVRHINLGEVGTADLLAAAGVLTVRTEVPFTITYSDPEQEFQCAVPAGVSTFDLR